MRRTGLLLLAVAALGLAACASQRAAGGPEAGPGDGAADPRASAELERLRAQAASLPPERAAESFEALASRYPGSSAGAEALYEAGLRWREAKRPERASAALGQLLTRYPLSRLAPQAKYQLALSELEAGRARDAYQTLVNLYDKLPRADQPDAARRIAEAAEAARLWPQAVRWYGELAALREGPERQRALTKAAEVVDGRLSFLEVARLKEELPADSPAMPAVTMKLARILVHLSEYGEAEARAREVVQRWPDGPYAPDALAMLERLGRRQRVNPGVVGVAVPLSGRFKGWGEAVVQGVELGLAERPGFRVVSRDTRGEADGATQAIQELAMAEGAVAVIGGVTNAEAQRAAAVAQELEIPLLTLSKVENVTEAGPYVFRNMLTASAQAAALVDYAMGRRGLKRFGVLYPNIPYGVELAGAFWDEVDARGGEMRAAETYEHDRTTFAPLVKSMVGKLYLDERADYLEKAREIAKNEKDPYRRAKAVEKMRRQLDPIVDFEAVFIPDFAKNLALIAPALAVEDVVTATCEPAELARIRKATGREELQPVQLLGGNGWDDPALLEKAGRYVQCAVFVDGFFAGSDRAETRRFVEAFQKANGRPPSILEASAYDAARMIRQAVERDRAQTRDAVRTSLAALKGFPGATGDISFDPRREPQRQLFFLTVDRSGIREMRPAELSAPGSGGD
jgi:ABC-type branched-subunit amino acid transport system substrate-binding protein